MKRKRQKGEGEGEREIEWGDEGHLLGVRPLGNALLGGNGGRRGLGNLALLGDELLVECLSNVDAEGLKALGGCSRALRAYSFHEPLWKDLATEQEERLDCWRGTWRRSVLGLRAKQEALIMATGLCSDMLYIPGANSRLNLRPYFDAVRCGIRDGSAVPIQRRSDMTIEEFEKYWTDKPFILTAPVKEWTAYRLWTLDSLRAQLGNEVFRAESVDWTLHTYLEYLYENADESPLYLFDQNFGQKEFSPGVSLSQQYSVPSCFTADFFDALGPDRPDYRWLIIGPYRSGSTWHKDPNGTSAWNAVISGSKYWIMLPPHKTPPGVYVSPDEGEVTSPVSLAEYCRHFLQDARQTPGAVEGFCDAGQVLHVPSGWWHLVINLDDSIAITQNFVPRTRIGEVAKFLRNRPTHVSGFASGIDNPYERFIEGMRKHYPDELHLLPDEVGSREPGTWESVRPADSQPGASDFSFGFTDE